ncbi:MAG TPA: glycoside hydrolase family 2 TIM barrel-domain containing protein [Solirubrobacteraceae bacterium]|nr:glycoside hydrolase family 2 TIM barrel-domain containing protein [Solirubrobacteraceae bacterium]
MRLFRLLPLALLTVLAALVPSTAQAADVPSAKTLYADGPSGRYLVDGQWLFRLDAADRGVRQRFYRQSSTSGWSRVTVPNVWNVGDDSEASMRGSVGWYRKDFELPDKKAALEWAMRFESVNYRSRVYLNGREIGRNAGAYIPFTVRLKGLRKRGVNRLVVRVDSRRLPTDFPPSGLSSTGNATGGWFNYGGIQREVYLQKLDTVQFNTVRVLPRLSCSTCPARIDFTLAMENVTNRTRRVSLIAKYGSKRIGLGTRTIGAGNAEVFSRRMAFGRARLWSPKSPYLYPVKITATSGGRTVGTYDLKSGVRSLKVSRGRLYLNGRPVNFRGVGVQEDTRTQGFAVDNAFRDRLVAEARAVGATVLRTHYPMHPYVHELADKLGLLIWSEIPVYAVKTTYLKRESVRALAAKEMRRNVETNLNHPSVFTWSVGNELSSKPGPVQGDYIKRASAIAKDIDPTRPTSIAFAGYPSAGCQGEYKPLDIIGVNEYYGWYPGPGGKLFDRDGLSGYLDQVRRCYPRHAIAVTEFGAEANREGPVEEKGTYGYQRDLVNFHLNVFASKPWLSGAIYWALNEFRVKPDWEGGNPRPTPPVHQKGLLTYDTMSRKPAWADVQRLFRATNQYP